MRAQDGGRAARLGASTLAVCAVLMLAAAGQAAASGFIGVDSFGVRCGDGQTNPNCLTNRDLRRMHHAHVKFARILLPWSFVQAAPGPFNWSVIDRTVGALANHGVRVLPLLTGPPHWVEPSFQTPPVNTPAARKGWRKFLKHAVARYGPGGDYWTDPGLYRGQHPNGRARPIKTWQIWNEPNLRQGAEYVRPRKYVRLVRLSHRAIRAADPHAKVLLGGMPGYVKTHAWVYLKKLYKHRGFKHAFDAVALHPFAGDKRDVLKQVKLVRRVMRRHHDGHSHLWISELGWGSKRPSSATPINQGPQGQKRLLKRTFRALRRHRHHWHLAHAFWFSWRDPPPGSPGCTFCSSSGLFHHSQKPKPSWRAFKQVSRHRHRH